MIMNKLNDIVVVVLYLLLQPLELLRVRSLGHKLQSALNAHGIRRVRGRVVRYPLPRRKQNSRTISDPVHIITTGGINYYCKY